MNVKNRWRSDSLSTTANMTKAANAARAEYMRKWRAANRDRVRVINQNYWARKAAKAAAQAAEEQ